MTQRESRHFDWLAVIVFPLAMVLMEAFSFYPWLAWVGGWPIFAWQRPPLSLLAVVLLLAAVLGVARLCNRPAWPLVLVRVVVLGSGMIAMLVVLRLEYGAGYGVFDPGWFFATGRRLANVFQTPDTIVIALPALVYLWWRGIRLGQKTSYSSDIYRSFLIGLVSLIILIIVWQISSASGRISPPGPDVGWIAIGFFFFGLLAIAISHLYTMRRAMPREEAALSPVRRWLPVMLGVIGFMVLIVFGLASIFSEDFFASIGHAFSVVSGALGKVLDYVLVPLNYIFEGIFWLLRWFLNTLRGCQSPPQPEGSANMTLPEMPEVVPRELPPEVLAVIRWLAISLVIGAVIFFLARAIARVGRQRDTGEIEEIHESLWSWKGFRDDLRELLGMVGQRFQRRMGPGERVWSGAGEAGRLSIREIYRHLQWEAARSGLPRRRAETVTEYAARIGQNVPDSDPPLTRLSGLYSAVRYGEVKPPEETIDEANNIWQGLRTVLRRLRGEG